MISCVMVFHGFPWFFSHMFRSKISSMGPASRAKAKESAVARSALAAATARMRQFLTCKRLRCDFFEM